jgi:pimeloyl-ACP methyl ester carboxylesterase
LLGALAIACEGPDAAQCVDPSDPRCVDAGDRSADAASDGGDRSGIGWTECALYSDGRPSEVRAECAEVEVPVRWADPAGPTLTLFVKRVPGTRSHRRQVWLLNGGPGGPGADFEQLAEPLARFDPESDVYLPDHRGTGLSTRLSCPEQEAAGSASGLTVTADEMPACIAHLRATWGDRIAGLSPTEAAHDLAALIERTREPGQTVHVFGGSYGTYLAQRFLQVRPDGADTVTLLGIAPPDVSFSIYDAEYDRVARDFLAVCAADPFCASKLGDDPAATFEDVYARLDAGHCPEAVAAGLDRRVLRNLFGATLLYLREERLLVPAAVHRLDRCAEEDIPALSRFAAIATAPQVPDVYDELQSPLLGIHIGLSELWVSPSPTPGSLEAISDAALASLDIGPRYAALADQWPSYVSDALDGVFAETDVPMLMMNGTLDPATPISGSDRVGAHFDGTHQHYVRLPGAPHTFASPYGGRASCSFDMWMAFLRDPEGPLDVSCAERLDRIDFRGDSLAATFFGTADLWETVDDGERALSATAETLADREARIRALRRALRATWRQHGM